MVALLLAACSGGDGGGAGGSGAGGMGGSDETGGNGGMAGTGGKAGMGGAGGRGGQGGTAGSGMAGQGGTAGSGMAGMGGTAGSGMAGMGGSAGSGMAGMGGTAGSGMAGMGGSAGSGMAGMGGGGGTGVSAPLCMDKPEATPPALRKGMTITIPNGGQAGQVVGVPGENIMYVIGHKNGRLNIVQDGKALTESLIDPISVATGGNNEQGLLSMALHPEFKTNQLFYVFYTAAEAGALKVDEYVRMSPTKAMFKRNVHTNAGSNRFHNGGSIYFSPKNPPGKHYLYHATGNAQSGGFSQNMTNPNGKILRYDVADGTGVPAMGAMAKTYALGLRNPYRMSVDRLTGDIWIGEVADGPGGSVLFIAGGKEAVTNFGYGMGGTAAGISGQQPGSAALIGGVVYRGTKIKGICGRYFYGMHAGGAIRSLIQENGMRVGGITNHPELTVAGNVSSFGEDGEGEIWMSSMNNNTITRIEGGM